MEGGREDREGGYLDERGSHFHFTFACMHKASITRATVDRTSCTYLLQYLRLLNSPAVQTSVSQHTL